MEEAMDISITIVSFFDNRIQKSVRETLSSKSIDVVCLGGTSRFDIKAWRNFQLELNNGYDLVHTHQNFSGSVARLVAYLEGVPIINTEHRDHESLSQLQNIVNSPTLPLADRIISNSQVTQNSFRWYEQLLIDHDQLRVIHNGVDVEQIQNVISDTSVAKDDIFRVCTAARMVPIKNQSNLIRAFYLVNKQHPDSELILLGDGPLRGELEQLTAELQIEDHIRFKGNVPRREVYEVFARSDVFAIPSHSEGFCVAAVEAMASELPVVASDIAVFHEVIQDGGLFVDQTNPEAFAQGILALKEDEDKYQKTSMKAKQRATTKFSLDKCTNEYYRVYKDVLEENT
ncbi:glycosyltransferase family 4 protein [Halorubrum ezzemoulense]|nr:glycosyltransferase family 4 protein [Halorubrum ezzemoulense]